MIEENHARYPSFGVSGEVQMAGNSRWGQGSVDDRADLSYSLSLLSLAGVGGSHHWDMDGNGPRQAVLPVFWNSSRTF